MKKSVKAKDCYNSVLQFIKTNNIMKAQNENKSENIYSLLLGSIYKYIFIISIIFMLFLY